MAHDVSDQLRSFVQNPNALSNEEAARRYQQIMRHLPPDVAKDANQYVFNSLPEDKRRELAQRFQAAHNDSQSSFNGFQFSNTEQAAQPVNLGKLSATASQQDPGLLSQLFGQDSPLGGTLGRMALAAIAAYLAKRFLSGQQAPQQHEPSDPLGGLGGLFGGQGGMSGGQPGSKAPGASGQGPNIGDLLGGLLGGGSGGPFAGNQSQRPDIGGLLGGLLGGNNGGNNGGDGSGLVKRPSTDKQI